MIPSEGPGLGAGRTYVGRFGHPIDSTLGNPRSYRRMTHRWSTGEHAPGNHAEAWNHWNQDEDDAGFVMHMTNSTEWLTLETVTAAVNAYGANDPDGSAPWSRTSAEVEQALELLRKLKIVLRDDDCMYCCPVLGETVELPEEAVRLVHGFGVTSKEAAAADTWRMETTAASAERELEVPLLMAIDGHAGQIFDTIDIS